MFLESLILCSMAEKGIESAVSAGIKEEAAFLGISILAGAALFLLYDVFRIFRRIVPHGTIWIGAEDFFYWLVCTAVVFVMLYHQNDGMIRGFAIGGVLLGMGLYFLLLSRFVVKINVVILKKILGVFLICKKVVWSPFAGRAKKIHSFVRRQLKKAQKLVKISLRKQ